MSYFEGEYIDTIKIALRKAKASDIFDVSLGDQVQIHLNEI